MLKRILNKASEIFFSTKISLLALILQLLCELLLVERLIAFFGASLGIFPSVEPDVASLLRAAINAWIVNFMAIMCQWMDMSLYLMQPTIPERWSLAQNRLENWIEAKIPRLSLAKLSLEIASCFANTVFLNIYIYFCSVDYRYLSQLIE